MEKKPTPKKWHTQHEKILQSWGETSSCYRYLHFKSYLNFKSLNMHFTMPIIVISTITGTANFAQETFPDAWVDYVPLGIGGLNLIAAILATVAQFLKISELMEAHRVASISYGKLSRDIRLELSLPILDRRHSGDDMVNRCSTEYDRLIEQSPPVPGKILDKFEKTFRKVDNFDKPEISQIKPIRAFDQFKENTLVNNVKNMFKKGIGMITPKSPRRNTVDDGISQHSITVYNETHKDNAVDARTKVLAELKDLKMKNLVTLRNSADDEFYDPSDIAITEGDEVTQIDP